jgi:uncharacterized protein (DUF58 family)
MSLDHRYLRPADLQRLRRLVFASRRPVEGLYSGRHVSPQRGHSVEFTDYRAYMPGDEISDIDWKVYGRSDKLFLKLFEQQSEMNVHLLVDGSASMNFAGIQASSSSPAKFDHAARLAAAIAFLVIQQQDRVSFGVAREGLHTFVAPGRSPTQLTHVLAALDQSAPGTPAKPRQVARLGDALESLVSRVGRRGLLVVISDLHEPPEPILRAISRFSHRGTEAIVFHVLHPDEIELPRPSGNGETLFTDSETGEQIAVNLTDIADDYRARMRARLEEWSTALRARGVDYNLVTTDHDYSASLQRYLVTRGAKA